MALTDHTMRAVMSSLGPVAQTGFVGTVAVGLAADRPVACESMLDWLYLATDTAGGTLYVCRFEPGTGFEWMKAARGATEVDGLAWSSAPASHSATGTAGDMAYDSTYFYVCVASNSWKRVAWAGSDAW